MSRANNVLADQAALYERQSLVQPMLQSLAGLRVTAQGIPGGGGAWIWVAFTGTQLSPAWKTWRIKTRVPRFEAQYWEQWLPRDAKATEYELSHAFFHLYCLRGPHLTPMEVIGLHWHPDTEALPSTSRFADGPHVHVSVAQYPLGRAHIGMDLSHWDEISSSVASLTSCLGVSIDMIRQEVLGHQDIGRLLLAAESAGGPHRDS